MDYRLEVEASLEAANLWNENPRANTENPFHIFAQIDMFFLYGLLNFCKLLKANK